MHMTRYWAPRRPISSPSLRASNTLGGGGGVAGEGQGVSGEARTIERGCVEGTGEGCENGGEIANVRGW